MIVRMPSSYDGITGRSRPTSWTATARVPRRSAITADPAVMMGKPIVRGTRLTVEYILDELAGGLTVDELVASHPRLTRDDIQAALAFAAESVRMERLGAVQHAV